MLLFCGGIKAYITNMFFTLFKRPLIFQVHCMPNYVLTHYTESSKAKHEFYTLKQSFRERKLLSVLYATIAL